MPLLDKTMTEPKHNEKPVTIVAGAGAGLGIPLCTALLAAGYRVAGLTRSATPLPQLGEDYLAVACDLTNAVSLQQAIQQIEESFGAASVYIHNAAQLLHQPFMQTSEADFTQQWQTICLAAALGAQTVLPNMLEQQQGSVLLIGATASVKAGGEFAAFASAKFALRGMAQAMARELAPQGIHVAHLILDGALWGPQARDRSKLKESQCISPQAVADTCLMLINQPSRAWTHEIDIRTKNEAF